MGLPTDRSTANTELEHVADHNTLHQQHNDLEFVEEALIVVRNEAPLPASRYVDVGMTMTQRTTALQSWLNAAGSVTNPQLRFDEKRYETNSTLIIPPVSGLDLGGLGIVAQPSSVFLDGSGTVIQPTANTPAFQFNANVPHGATVPYAQFFHDFVIAYAAPSGTTNTNQVPFVYDAGSFHQSWRRIVTINAFRGWEVKGTGAYVWNCDWEHCTAYGTQRNVWDMTATAGQPMLSWRNCGVFNTNTTVVADGPVWRLSAVLEYLIDAEVEGWRQVILDTDSSVGKVERLHVEHHEWGTSGAFYLLNVATGKMKVGNLQVTGVTGGNGSALTVVGNSADSSAVFDMEFLTVDINRLVPATDPGFVSYFYGPGRFMLRNEPVVAGGITPTLTGYGDAATALRVTGFNDSTSALRLGPNSEHFGTGIPASGLGINGDFYKRLDGTVAGNTVLYHKEGGAWVALITG